MSLKDAVGAEQYLAKHSLKTTLQWLTHEVIINKPGSPLQFLRDLLTAKINQTPSSSKKSPASGLSSGELAVLVGNAELALSKCVQAASGSKDADDRTRAAALVAGLRGKLDQLSSQLDTEESNLMAPVSTLRQRVPAPAPVSTGTMKASRAFGGSNPMDMARNLAMSGLKTKVTPTIGEEASDSDEEDTPQTAHTPPEWKVEGEQTRGTEEVESRAAAATATAATAAPTETKLAVKPRSSSLGRWTMEDRCNAAFTKMDTDNDGFLSRKEFEKALKQIGFTMTARAMHKLLNKIDVNQDGEISRQEFLDFYKRAKEEGGDEIIDIAEVGNGCLCLPSRPLAILRRQSTSLEGEDENYDAPGYYKYAALVAWCVHAREGFKRRKHLMGKAKQISSDSEMNNYLRGNPLHESGGNSMSFALMESRQDGSDPDVNAKIIARARKNYKIIPDDAWYLAWTMFTMILILFYMGVVPVRLGFSAYADDNAFVQGREAWYWVDFVADSVFLLDIAMNFFVIIKHGNGDYIVNFVDIAIFQIHSKWFYVDLLASFPTSYMSYDEYSSFDDEWTRKQPRAGDINAEAEGDEGISQLNGVNKLLRLVRIIKLARVFRMLRFMKDFEDLAIVNPSSLRLVRLLVVFVIILHFVACGFWALASMDGFCQDDSACDADISWYIQKESAQNAHLTTQYMWAFYWAVSAMTGVGYDIEPRTYGQHVYTTVIIVCGMFMNAVLIGSVPGAIENLDRTQTERKQELDNINDYLRKQHVPTYLQRSVRSYYEYLHGCDYDTRKKESELLKSLPDSLKTRVKVATAIRAIERIPLFSELHASCKIQIIERLTPLVVVPGERLAVQDDVGDAMYIIKHGRIQLKRAPKPKRAAQAWKSAARKVGGMLDPHKGTVNTALDEKSKRFGDVADNAARQIVKVAELGAGDFFGENCLLGRKNDTMAVAADYSDLLVSVNSVVLRSSKLTAPIPTEPLPNSKYPFPLVQQLTVEDCKELCEEYEELKEQITSVAKSRYLAHVPHEERHDEDIKHLEESIRLERGALTGGAAPPSTSRLSTRRMTRLLMDEFADIGGVHGMKGVRNENKDKD